MCTLTYIPFSKGYILTHNRDEDRARPTSSEIHRSEVAGKIISHPKDLQAEGTWMATANNGSSICLLNGGQKNYQRKPPYRHSRGLVPLHFFKYETARHFFKEYNFSGLEPFTLIIKDVKGLFKLTHDLDEDRIYELDPFEKGIWSSTTLYTKEVRKKREAWFEAWLANTKDFTPASLRNFHLSTGDGDKENDLVMSRWGIVETQSLTQVNYLNSHQMYYLDLQANRPKTFSYP